MLSRARLPFLKSPVLQEFIVFRYWNSRPNNCIYLNIINCSVAILVP
jgi:hypothetical protein